MSQSILTFVQAKHKRSDKRGGTENLRTQTTTTLGTRPAHVEFHTYHRTYMNENCHWLFNGDMVDNIAHELNE
jgi:hypothetical protein